MGGRLNVRTRARKKRKRDRKEKWNEPDWPAGRRDLDPFESRVRRERTTVLDDISFSPIGRMDFSELPSSDSP